MHVIARTALAAVALVAASTVSDGASAAIIFCPATLEGAATTFAQSGFSASGSHAVSLPWDKRATYAPRSSYGPNTLTCYYGNGAFSLIHAVPNAAVCQLTALPAWAQVQTLAPSGQGYTAQCTGITGAPPTACSMVCQ